VGAQNEEKDWVLTPRRVRTEKFPGWAKKNIRAGDIVVLETTTNVWATYDIVEPLASRVLVANAAEVGEIANARVKTDKEDVKRLLKLLIGGIVLLVWMLTRQEPYANYSSERIAYKYYTWSWQLNEAQRKGLTCPQFVRYYLMRLGIGSELQRVALDPKHPHRLASKAEILALMPELHLPG
jgi:hypothetical protein